MEEGCGNTGRNMAGRGRRGTGARGGINGKERGQEGDTRKGSVIKKNVVERKIRAIGFEKVEISERC